MSVEIESTQLSKSKEQKKKRGKDVEKQVKKRKRHASDDLEQASSTKRHRSDHQPRSPVTQDSAQTQFAVPSSPFSRQTSSLYLPLPPISQKHALQGLCAEHLSPLILTYYPPFHAVIISYSGARLSSESNSRTDAVYARAVDEYAASFVWLTADFIIFQPQKGNVLEGWINLQNESNVGLLCLNFFNATIERKRLPKEWKWVSGGMKPPAKRRLKEAAASGDTDLVEAEGSNEGAAEEDGMEDVQGYFKDAQGKKVEGLIRFKVKNLETSRSMDRETGFLNIEGTLLSDEMEKDLQEQEAIMTNGRGKKQSKRALTGRSAGVDKGSIDRDQSTNHKSSNNDL